MSLRAGTTPEQGRYMQNKVNFITKKRLIIPALLLLVLLSACGASKDALSAGGAFLPAEDAPAEETETTETAKALPAPVCFVHVCGAVVREGVYELPEGARVFEAIAAAGGLLPEADASAVNQAQCVSDGSRLRIPFAGEQTEEGADAAGPAAKNGLIDINTASEQELQTLSGIGEKRARDIVRYRETNGAFLRIEDLMKVDGIKQKLFEQIRELITV